MLVKGCTSVIYLPGDCSVVLIMACYSMVLLRAETGRSSGVHNASTMGGGAGMVQDCQKLYQSGTNAVHIVTAQIKKKKKEKKAAQIWFSQIRNTTALRLHVEVPCSLLR